MDNEPGIEAPGFDPAIIPLGARLKVERAAALLEVLKQEVLAFVRDEERPYAFEVGFDPDGKTAVISIRIVKPTPVVWSIQIGEILHNLRSALDHVVYELSAQHQGGVAPARCEFPIFTSEDRFMESGSGGGLFKVRGLPEPLRALIKAWQPFNHKESPERHMLWALQDLSNRDKHRLLHLTSVQTAAFDLTLTPEGGASVEPDAVLADGPVKDGDAIASYTLSGLVGRGGKVTVEGNFAYSVGFGEEGVFGGFLIVESLAQLVQATMTVIKDLVNANQQLLLEAR